MLRQVVASYTAVARPVTRRCALGPQFKFVQRAARIPGNQGGFADEIGLNVVEPKYMQSHIARRRESGPGRRAFAAPAQRAVNRHGLSGIFNSATDSQAVVRAQRVIGQPMSGAAAADMLRVPLDDFIEQAHASVMGNILCDPGTVQGHGSIRTSSRDTSRYSRIVLPLRRSASRRSSGSARAAGHPQRSASRAGSVSRS